MDKKEFRSALGRFPTGVTVVTAIGPTGEVIGVTISSFNSVSMDPPLVLFSLNRRTYSLTAFLSTHYFAINVLRQGQEGLSDRFAKASEDKWRGIKYESWDTGCPILTDAAAAFECKTEHAYEGGDHIIVVGKVLWFHHDPDALPLIFFGGRYGTINPGS